MKWVFQYLFLYFFDKSTQHNQQCIGKSKYQTFYGVGCAALTCKICGCKYCKSEITTKANIRRVFLMHFLAQPKRVRNVVNFHFTEATNKKKCKGWKIYEHLRSAWAAKLHTGKKYVQVAATGKSWALMCLEKKVC